MGDGREGGQRLIRPRSSMRVDFFAKLSLKSEVNLNSIEAELVLFSVTTATSPPGGHPATPPSAKVVKWNKT